MVPTPVPTRSNFQWPKTTPRLAYECSDAEPKWQRPVLRKIRFIRNWDIPQTISIDSCPPQRLQLLLCASQLKLQESDDDEDVDTVSNTQVMSNNSLSLSNSSLSASSEDDENELQNVISPENNQYAYSDDELDEEYNEELNEESNETTFAELSFLSNNEEYEYNTEYNSENDEVSFAELATLSDIDEDHFGNRQEHNNEIQEQEEEEEKRTITILRYPQPYTVNGLPTICQPTQFMPLLPQTMCFTNFDRPSFANLSPIIVKPPSLLLKADTSVYLKGLRKYLSESELYGSPDLNTEIKPNSRYNGIAAHVRKIENEWALNIHGKIPDSIYSHFHKQRGNQTSDNPEEPLDEEHFNLKRDLISKLNFYGQGVVPDDYILYQLSCVANRALKDVTRRMELPQRLQKNYLEYCYSRLVLKNAHLKQLYGFCSEIMEERDRVLEKLKAVFPESSSKVDELLKLFSKDRHERGFQELLEKVGNNNEEFVNTYKHIFTNSFSLIDCCVNELTKNIQCFIKMNEIEYLNTCVIPVMNYLSQRPKKAKHGGKPLFKDLMCRTVLKRVNEYVFDHYVVMFKKRLESENNSEFHEGLAEIKHAAWKGIRNEVMDELVAFSWIQE